MVFLLAQDSYSHFGLIICHTNGNHSHSSNPLAAATTFKNAKGGRDKDARIALGANDRSVACTSSQFSAWDSILAQLTRLFKAIERCG